MRSLPPALEAALAGGVTTLARCWRFVRDGATVRACDHDRDLTIAGETFAAALAPAPGPLDQGTTLSGSSLALNGALEIAGLAEDDLALGRWDGARVEMLVCDWRDPVWLAPVWTGLIRGMTRRGTAWEVDLAGPESLLSAPVGRVIQRTCDATLGDARCGVNLSGPGLSAGVAVQAGSGPRRLACAVATGVAPESLAAGAVRFESGRLQGVRVGIVAAAVSGGILWIDLASPLALLPAAGDLCRISVGCDKSWTLCRERFANTARFRGCPLLPGETRLLEGPRA